MHFQYFVYKKYLILAFKTNILLQINIDAEARSWCRRIKFIKSKPTKILQDYDILIVSHKKGLKDYKPGI